MKETELKPCKCGCEAEVVESQAFSWCDITYYVRCTNPVCEERGALKYEYKIDAINAWNRRQGFLSPLTEEKLLINDSKSNNGEVMRNKQISEIAKILIEYEDCGECEKCNFQTVCGEKRVATNLYEAGYRKQSKWISVDDRLPEDVYGKDREQITVLVYTEGKKVSQCSRCAEYKLIEREPFDRNVFRRTGKFYWNKSKRVTHWMPLPQPPKEK